MVFLPSLSISKTLMASSGLRERNSLAGSVWRRPCGTGERIWSGLMNDSALTTDMFVLFERLSGKKSDGELSLWLYRAL